MEGIVPAAMEQGLYTARTLRTTTNTIVIACMYQSRIGEFDHTPPAGPRHALKRARLRV
jgi:hypothetical protein